MKKRERDIAADVSAAVDDLVRTIRRKEAEFTMAGKERVKVGEAWAVKVCGRGSSGLWAGRSTLNMTAFRHERALLDLEIARGVLEYWRRLVYAPRIVRVTFYEVRRG